MDIILTVSLIKSNHDILSCLSGDIFILQAVWTILSLMNSIPIIKKCDFKLFRRFSP